MDLTPETLRSATFRDKLRGYHPDDVDEFLESVARGLDVLLARLRDATDKARALPPPEPAASSQTDEAVKTLALAQRTADLAIHEAKAEAERLVRAAEQKSRRLVGDAEESATHLAETAQTELRADLERLQTSRDQLVGEVQALGTWLEGERSRIRNALIEVADRIDNVRDAGDAPVPKPVSVPAPPRKKLEAQRSKPAVAPPATAPATPPVERAKAAVPPPAAPSPNLRSTPPGGQPAVRTAAQATPEPAPQEPAPPAPPRKVSKPSDAAVLDHAQQGLAAKAAQEPEPSAYDDEEDPFFAELRAAMLDQSPLGPREDDD